MPDDAEQVERWRGYFRVRTDKETGLFVAGAVKRCVFHERLRRFVPIWDPIAYGESIQDLLEECRQLGLVKLHGISKEVSDIVCYWLDNGERATDHVEAIWQKRADLSAKRPLGFMPTDE